MSAKQLTALIVLTAAGFLAGVLFLPLSLRYNWLGSAALLSEAIGGREVVTRVEERTTVVPKSDYFADAIEKVQGSVVAVQAFRQGALLRSGSGIVLTEDGLVATVNSVVPPEAKVFQVTKENRIYQASVIFRDYSKNLAVISVPGLNARAGQFKNATPQLADTLLVYSRQVRLGKDLAYIAGALASQVVADTEFKISTAYYTALFGAAVVDTNGNILAMLDFKNGRPQAIAAPAVTAVLVSYLNSVKP